MSTSVSIGEILNLSSEDEAMQDENSEVPRHLHIYASLLKLGRFFPYSLSTSIIEERFLRFYNTIFPENISVIDHEEEDIDFEDIDLMIEEQERLRKDPNYVEPAREPENPEDDIIEIDDSCSSYDFRYDEPYRSIQGWDRFAFSSDEPLTSEQALERYAILSQEPCTSKQALERYSIFSLLTQGPSISKETHQQSSHLMQEPSTSKQAYQQQPSTSKQADEQQPCSSKQADEQQPCSSKQADEQQPCSSKQADEQQPCSSKQALEQDQAPKTAKKHRIIKQEFAPANTFTPSTSKIFIRKYPIKLEPLDKPKGLKRFAVDPPVIPKRLCLAQLPLSHPRVILYKFDDREVPSILYKEEFLNIEEIVDHSEHLGGVDENDDPLIDPITRPGNFPLPFKELDSSIVRRIYGNDFIKSMYSLKLACVDNTAVDLLTDFITIQHKNHLNPTDVLLLEAWKLLIRRKSARNYRLFINSMVKLVVYQTRERERTLAILTAHSYILMLAALGQTIARASVFSTTLIKLCMKPFRLLDSMRELVIRHTIKKEDFIRTQVHLLLYLNDLSDVLKNIQELEQEMVFNCIIKTMSAIIRQNYCIGYESIYMWEFTNAAFEVLEAICLIGLDEVRSRATPYNLLYTSGEGLLPIGIRMVFVDLYPLLKNNKNIKVYEDVPLCEDDKRHLVSEFFKRIIIKKPRAGMQTLTYLVNHVCREINMKSEAFETFMKEIFYLDEFLFETYTQTLLHHIDNECNVGPLEDRTHALTMVRIFVKTPLKSPNFQTLRNKRIAPREYMAVKTILHCISDPDARVQLLAMKILLECFDSNNVLLQQVMMEIFHKRYEYEFEANSFNEREQIYKKLTTAASLRMEARTLDVILVQDDSDDETIESRPHIPDSQVYPLRKRNYLVPNNIEIFMLDCSNLLSLLRRLFNIGGPGICEGILEVFQKLAVLHKRLFEQYDFIKFVIELQCHFNFNVRLAAFQFLINIINLIPWYEPALYLFVQCAFSYTQDNDLAVSQYATATLRGIFLQSIEPSHRLTLLGRRQWRLFKVMFLNKDRDLYFMKLKKLMVDKTWACDAYKTLLPYLWSKRLSEAWVLLLFLQNFIPHMCLSICIKSLKEMFVNRKKFPLMDFSVVFAVLLEFLPKCNKFMLLSLRTMAIDLMIFCLHMRGISGNLYRLAIRTFVDFENHTGLVDYRWIKHLHKNYRIVEYKEQSIFAPINEAEMSPSYFENRKKIYKFIKGCYSKNDLMRMITVMKEINTDTFNTDDCDQRNIILKNLKVYLRRIAIIMLTEAEAVIMDQVTPITINDDDIIIINADTSEEDEPDCELDGNECTLDTSKVSEPAKANCELDGNECKLDNENGHEGSSDVFEIDQQVVLMTEMKSLLTRDFIKRFKAEYPTLEPATKKLGVILYMALNDYIKDTEPNWNLFIQQFGNTISLCFESLPIVNVKPSSYWHQAFLEHFVSKNLSTKSKKF